MQIESRVQDIPRELRYSGTGDVASRQRSVTSDPGGGDASRASASQQKNDFTPVAGADETRKPAMEAIDLKVTVEKLNQMIRDQQKDVAFSVDEEANTTVIKVFKTKTGELIKQFPPEEILAMKAKLRKYTGWLVDKKM